MNVRYTENKILENKWTEMSPFSLTRFQSNQNFHSERNNVDE